MATAIANTEVDEILNEIRKTRISFFKWNLLLHLWQMKFEFIYFSFSSRKLHKNYQIKSHTCLMLSVYESFHQMGYYGQQRNHILQDLTGLES